MSPYQYPMEKARIIYISVKMLASHVFSFRLVRRQCTISQSPPEFWSCVGNLIERGNTLNGPTFFLAEPIRKHPICVEHACMSTPALVCGCVWPCGPPKFECGVIDMLTKRPYIDILPCLPFGHRHQHNLLLEKMCPCPSCQGVNQYRTGEARNIKQHPARRWPREVQCVESHSMVGEGVM